LVRRHHVSIRQHTPAYFSIRRHPSAYASIRQHTPAYASIRQHKPAYVNIRQHPSERNRRTRGACRGGLGSTQKKIKYRVIPKRGTNLRRRRGGSKASSNFFFLECAPEFVTHPSRPPPLRPVQQPFWPALFLFLFLFWSSAGVSAASECLFRDI
jgi:hypothetical protein